MKAINYSKIAKRSHAYKGYARTNEVDILSSFNPKLHVSDTESTIRGELKNLLTELKEFKFMITLVLEFKKIESDDETKYSTFYSSSKAETIIMRVILIMHLNQSIVQLYQTCKNILHKGLGWIIDLGGLLIIGRILSNYQNN